MRLLVVDWDYFCDMHREDESMLYDWGHNESSRFYMEGIWPIRAAELDNAGEPRPELSGKQKFFWDRFDIDPEATLFFSDSNAFAIHEDVSEDIEDVWLYDAHHDSGYNTMEGVLTGVYTCEDWMAGYDLMGVDTHVRYPVWKTYAFEIEPRGEALVENDRAFDYEDDEVGRIDRIFVCRSGAWTPPWFDPELVKFVDAAPVTKRIRLDEGHPVSWPREWDETNVKRLQEEFKSANEFALAAMAKVKEG